MEINFNELTEKILKFWSKNDGKEFNVNEIRQNFNHYELATILYAYDFYSNFSNIVLAFRKKILKINNLFSNQEIEQLVEDEMYKEYFLKYLSDDKLLSLINNDEYEDNIIMSLSSDTSKIMAFNKFKDMYFKSEVIASLDSDELKIKYAKKVNKQYRQKIYNSVKNKNLLENELSLTSSNKGDIISSLSSDEKKEYYFKKYYRFLSKDDKVKIISSISNEALVLQYLQLFDDLTKGEIIKTKFNKTDEFIEKVLQMIKSNQVISDIVSNLEEELIVKHIYKVPDSNKIDIIKQMQNSKFKFDSLCFINDKNLLFSFIEHCEEFPDYSEEYEYIISLYATKYNLNREHLLVLVNTMSLSILKVIKNPNIIKLINATPEEFSVVMSFFEQDQLKMSDSALNDFLNSVLQREFRIKQADIILTYPTILSAIENNNRQVLEDKLKMIATVTDVDSILNKYGWDIKQFIDLLLVKDSTAMGCMHDISTKFIMLKRSSYITENIAENYKYVTKQKYNKNSIIKCAIDKFPIELLLSLFPDMTLDDKLIDKFTNEEIALLKNRDLIYSIIIYRKNPNIYNQIPSDIKLNMHTFNNVLGKILSSSSFKQFFKHQDVSLEYESYNANSEYLISILMNLDIDKMRVGILKNPELLNNLKKIWNQYRIGSWNNGHLEVLFKAGLMGGPEIIANFIQYFALSYEFLQGKVYNEKVSKISLTSILDLSASYSTESKRYSMILGKENFRYIASNPSPNASTMLKEDRIQTSIGLIKNIRNRKYVTIPPLDKNYNLKNNKKINAVVGNFSNPINLTYGERTGSCMRIGGPGQSLFDFCLNDKNGFHIRFSDPVSNEFVSRVSGFRNGNTVFLNQLRFSEHFNYSNDDIVEACKLVAEELINLSLNSKYPIDNVVISPDYAMKDSKMSAQNLNISDPQAGMDHCYIDVDENSILLASSDINGNLVPIKLGNKKVPEYKVQRERCTILYNQDGCEYVAHLKAVDQLLNGKNIEDIEFELKDSYVVCYAGEDWCVTVDKNSKIETYVMDKSNDKKQALLEVQKVVAYLQENLNHELKQSSTYSLGGRWL